MKKLLVLIMLLIVLIIGFFIFKIAGKNNIWQPKPNTSWQWQLNGNIDSSLNVDMYDIDLFDSPVKTIKSLKKRGVKVICYFSAGTFEDWRPDAGSFPKIVKGNKMQDWDELWLDISNLKALAPIMIARLDLAKEKGCDGVEPDNVDAYDNDTVFKISYNQQLRYNKFLAKEAHKRGLSVGLKNDLGQVKELVNYYDWALNEQCFEEDECGKLLPFIKQNKAVFGVEYNLKPNDFCTKANKMNFDWLYKKMSLESYRLSCR